MGNKFNTHGGYFAPAGYLKVETGGSHEENPNGGVQVGMDSQGIPNMLEEGEPVYNDFVYSDNIIATEEMLVKHHLPKKLAGKLFSEIADKFVDDAALTPLDPIENNGLNAMLVRLAEAQEEQKQIKMQKELEKELSKLSPKELTELETMLAQQEEEASVEEELPVEDEVVMSRGGKMHRYGEGGPSGNGHSGVRTGKYDDATPIQRLMDAVAPGYLDILHGDLSTAGKTILAEAPLFAITGGKSEAGVAARAAIKATKEAKTVKKAGRAAMDMSKWGKMLYDPSFVARRAAATEGMSRWGKMWRGAVGSLPALSWELPVTGKTIEQVGDVVSARRNATTKAQYDAAKQSDPFADVHFACGGKMNKYDLGDELDLPYKFITVPSLLDVYNSQFSGNKFQRILPASARGTALYRYATAEPTTVSTPATTGSGSTYTKKDVSPRISDVELPALKSPKGLPTNEEIFKIETPKIGITHLPYKYDGIKHENTDDSLPTWPRYAGLALNGILGLYNAFQEPDKYKVPMQNPVLPSGRMNLVDPVYNPIDRNQVVNQVMQNAAAQARAIRQAGLGPSTGAALLAHGYNTGRVAGTALSNAWDANNRRLNDVIGLRNTNEVQRANFDYGISKDRAGILNAAELQNNQNRLLQQRLNYEAEAAKYAALQSNLDSIAEALSAIGTENARRNSANSTTTDYETDENNTVKHKKTKE